MKKSVCMLLCVALMCTLCACTKPSTPATGAEGNVEANGGEEIGNPEDSEGSVGPSGTTEFNQDATIEEMVLVDENDIKITVTGIEYQFSGPSIKLHFENNSDEELEFFSDANGTHFSAVNGYMMEGYGISEPLSAGSTADTGMLFTYEQLADYGIYDIADVDLSFEILNEDYVSTQYGPYKIKTSHADSYDYAGNTFEKIVQGDAYQAFTGITIESVEQGEIYNCEGVTINSKAIGTDENGVKTIVLDVCNNSTESKYLRSIYIYLDGLFAHPYEWDSTPINPGCHNIYNLNPCNAIRESEREQLGLSDISEVKVSFYTCDKNVDRASENMEVTFHLNDASKALTPYAPTGEVIYEGNGARVYSQGLAEGVYDEEGVTWVLVVENNNAYEQSVTPDHSHIFVNDIVTFVDSYYIKVPANTTELLLVRIRQSTLEENGITSTDMIKKLDLDVEIGLQDKYKSEDVKFSVAY